MPAMVYQPCRSRWLPGAHLAQQQRPKRGPRSELHAPLEAAAGQLPTQHLLVELADARLRDLSDEGELVRQPPLRAAAAQMLNQLPGARCALTRQHHATH